jgi:peptidoglycan hydrolase-like protein with peptidoglycan-binding domain
MFCERTRRVGKWLAGLLAATVLLSLPASSLAADRSPAGDELATAGTLTRGAGYGSQPASEPVRELQRRLRRLGDRPGPIDGLYGPLTAGAVERFQRAQGLEPDGVVGPRTKRRLLAQGAQRPVADTSRTPHTGRSERKSPVGNNPAESATDQPARSATSGALTRAGPQSSPGMPAGLLALLAALAAGALVLALRAYAHGGRAREARINFGMVFAALLAVFVIGAAAGAMFATQAAPDVGGGASADSGALLTARSAPSQPAATEMPTLGRLPETQRAGRATTARDPAPSARVAAPSARNSSAPAARGSSAPAAERSFVPASGGSTTRATPASPEPRAPVRRPRPAAGAADAATYTVRPGDALWPIAERHLAPSSSVAGVAQKVQALEALNVDRIESGDPDLIEVGEELRLR